ncbi:DUF6069 family protein [Amycolatopsis albispora]|uniref:Cell envelope biogenesis protein OmpA n=1 Tax=Amycolatopsis albispora TaxID=1804986 RepID=A0A344LEY3_9PSEU|nr:DUF6069 family protein [Amycolatopsis albispora]AXB46607.1 hypothetical protein A4R43_32640 [Amycolatopsis albispora]
MSVTTAAPAATTVTGGGLTAAAVASAATATVAAAAEFAGIAPVVGGTPIPAFGFAVLTAICSVLGLVLALVLARTASHPRRAFVRATVALTVLSLAPDVLADALVTTKALLMLTHVVAAAIVIPAVARRLPA